MSARNAATGTVNFGSFESTIVASGVAFNSLWFKLDSLDQGDIIYGTSSGQSVLRIASTTTELDFVMSRATTDRIWTTSDAGLTTNKWYFLALVANYAFTVENVAAGATFWLGTEERAPVKLTASITTEGNGSIGNGVSTLRMFGAGTSGSTVGNTSSFFSVTSQSGTATLDTQNEYDDYYFYNFVQPVYYQRFDYLNNVKRLVGVVFTGSGGRWNRIVDLPLASGGLSGSPSQPGFVARLLRQPENQTSGNTGAVLYSSSGSTAATSVSVEEPATHKRYNWIDVPQLNISVLRR